jgi:hypothetical protein
MDFNPEKMWVDIFNCLNGDKSDFWQGLDEKYLNDRFRRPSKCDLESITPFWNTTLRAKLKNEGAQEYLEQCSLFISESNRLRQLLFLARDYTYESYRPDSKLLRVIGFWFKQTHLSPPVLWSTSKGLLTHFDGFHRLYIALNTNTEIIPFYCKIDTPPDGVIRIDDPLSLVDKMAIVHDL